MSRNDSRAHVIQTLSRRLRQFERSRRPVDWAASPASTGIRAIDELLPEGGLPGGTLVEWMSDGRASGASTLALTVAGVMLQPGGIFLVVDSQREFYSPAAAGLGIDLDRTIVVRPEATGDAIWALEQSLRSKAVAVAMCWIDRCSDLVFRRLQLAAEAGGGMGLLMRPLSARGQPSWADVRFQVQPLPSPVESAGRRLRVELLRCRGGMSGRAVELEISDETGLVRLAPELACAAPSQCAAGAV